MILLAAANSISQVYLGWADEFKDGDVECYAVGNNGGCSLMAEFNGHFWNDVSGHTIEPPTWALIGQQGANSTGRSNARAKVNFRFRQTNSGGYCATATAEIIRYRMTTVPAEGSACPPSGAVYVGTSSQTFDSCGFAQGSVYTNVRLLPVLDFSLESATGKVGYDDTIEEVSTGLHDDSCYSIYWF